MNRPAFIYAAYPPAATVTATSTASGLTAADVLESTEDTGWRPATIAGAQSLTIDLGDSLPIGCVALAGEYLNGITLEVRASSDNFGGVDIQISPPAALAQHVATWRQWTQAPYRYWKLIFTGLGLSTEIYHAALCRYEPLPFLDDGADPDIMQAEGSHLISQSGYYMGSYQQRAMRALSLDFGQVTEAQYEIFQRSARPRGRARIETSTAIRLPAAFT